MASSPRGQCKVQTSLLTELGDKIRFKACYRDWLECRNLSRDKFNQFTFQRANKKGANQAVQAVLCLASMPILYAYLCVAYMGTSHARIQEFSSVGRGGSPDPNDRKKLCPRFMFSF